MSTLVSTKPEDLGFPDGIPGHRLSDAEEMYSNPNPWQEGYYKFTCSCGFEISDRVTKGGKMGRRAIQSFKEHIDAEAALPDEIVEVGIVSKPRVTWNVKVIPRTYQYADSYVTGTHLTEWATGGPGWWSQYGWAVVIDKTSKRGKTSKSLVTISRSRLQAVRKAHDLISKQEEVGFDVAYQDNTVPTPSPIVVPTFRNTFSELLERTDVALRGRDMLDVEATIREIDEVLGLIPVIQARRDELAAVWDERTVGLLQQ